LKKNPLIFFAGQISGVEGYVESIATGLFAAINAIKFLKKEELIPLPQTTMLGSLIRFVTTNLLENPQPMRANFGIIPADYFELPKKTRKKKFVEDSIKSIELFKRSL